MSYKKKAPVQKVTKEELKQIQNFVSQLKNGAMRVGEIEIEKHNVLHSVNQIQSDLGIFQNNLKEKYGDKKVDLQTGELKSNIIE